MWYALKSGVHWAVDWSGSPYQRGEGWEGEDPLCGYHQGGWERGCRQGRSESNKLHLRPTYWMRLDLLPSPPHWQKLHGDLRDRGTSCHFYLSKSVVNHTSFPNTKRMSQCWLSVWEQTRLLNWLQVGPVKTLLNSLPPCKASSRGGFGRMHAPWEGNEELWN